MATQQQNMAVEEAKRSGVQARSILVFTALTIVFLPLTFFTSYFGMNLSDGPGITSRVVWTITEPISVGIIVVVFAVVRAMNAVLQHDEERGMKSRTEIEVESSCRSRLRSRGSKLKRVWICLKQTTAMTPFLAVYRYMGSCLLQDSKSGAPFGVQQGLRLLSHTSLTNALWMEFE